MSKNKVLSENTIRRFQKLANIGTLSENYMQEMQPGYAGSQEAPAQEEMEGHLPEQMDEEEVEVGVEAGGDKQSKVRELLALIAEISGIEMDVSDEEGGAGEEEIGGDAGDMMGAAGALEADEEEGEEDEEEGGEEEVNEAAEEEEEDEMDESASVSDDAMVESIVRRVTARLLEEAKKAGKGKKLTLKQKMALKKAQKDQKSKKYEDKKAAKPVEEATAATGGGPLLKKGGNKHDVWAGTSDMTLGKGDKGGQGGHKLSPLKGTKKNAV